MRVFLVVFVALLFMDARAIAGPVTFTGAQLLTTPGVSFPGEAPTTQGNSLRFAFPTNDSILFSIDLRQFVDNPAHLVFSGNLTRVTNDHDPRFYLTDGLNAVGVNIADASLDGLPDRGVITASFGELNNNLVSFDGAPGLADGFEYITGSVFSFTATIHAQKLETLISASIAGVSGTRAIGTVLELSRPLSLIFVAATVNASRNEIYQINALTLDSIPVPVPEPGTMGIFLLVLSGLIAFRRMLV